MAARHFFFSEFCFSDQIPCISGVLCFSTPSLFFLRTVEALEIVYEERINNFGTFGSSLQALNRKLALFLRFFCGKLISV